jgi:apoptosis-inducing factor 3
MPRLLRLKDPFMYDQRPCSCVEIYARYRAKSLSSIIDRAQDCALIAAAQTSRRAVVIGASFIGLEVAASLRTPASRSTSLVRRRVHWKRIMGAEIGDFIRNVHEQHGVTFRLGTTATAINAHDGGRARQQTAALRSMSTSRPARLGSSRQAISLVGRIVSPMLGSASSIGSSPSAKARLPPAISSGRENGSMRCLSSGSQHYDTVISYVGHAEHWDKIEIDGRVDACDCTATYTLGGRKLAVVTAGRDLESLGAELELEKASAAQ